MKDDTKLDKGRKVRVYDVGRNRHYLGKVLYAVRLDEHGQEDAWMIELRSGNRGCFDSQHTQFID